MQPEQATWERAKPGARLTAPQAQDELDIGQPESLSNIANRKGLRITTQPFDFIGSST
jgi:hypothetical protein